MTFYEANPYRLCHRKKFIPRPCRIASTLTTISALALFCYTAMHLSHANAADMRDDDNNLMYGENDMKYSERIIYDQYSSTMMEKVDDIFHESGQDDWGKRVKEEKTTKQKIPAAKKDIFAETRNLQYDDSNDDMFG
eukprot:90087-Ditylum_brightwellii.AAC.1